MSAVPQAAARVGARAIRMAEAQATRPVWSQSQRNADHALGGIASAHAEAVESGVSPLGNAAPEPRQPSAAPVTSSTVAPRDHGRLRHRMLAYTGVAQFLDVAVPFLVEGAADGEGMLVITTADRAAAVRSHLPVGVDVDFADVHTWYQTPGQAMANCREYLLQAGGISGLRVIGEPPMDNCTAEELAEWACYESAFNVAFADVPMQVICPYQTTAVPAAAVAEARRTHPERIIRGTSEPSARYVDPWTFAPAAEPDLLPAPVNAASADLDVRDRRAAARFATRQAFDAGLFGRHARTFALAVAEAVADLAAHGASRGRLRVWTEKRELVCEIAVAGRDLPRIAGYVPHSPGSSDDRGLWLTRQLCRLVQLHTTPDGTVAILRYPLRHQP